MKDYSQEPYPYHQRQYDQGDGRVEWQPCKHCSPGRPCATLRGVFDPFPGTDATMFIQWKGTDVCMDFHCDCGESYHVHGDFVYVLECPACGAKYELGTQVRARKLADQEADEHEPKMMELQ